MSSPVFNQCSSIWELLCRRAESDPDNPFLIDGHSGARFSYQQVRALAENLAGFLHDQGMAAGEVVSWQFPTRIETIVLSLALCRLDVVQNPVIHLYRDKELKELLIQTRPQWILVPPADAKVDYPAMARKIASETGSKVVILDQPLGSYQGSELPATVKRGSGVRWLYCTSGTTSGPKAVRHTDQTLLAGGHALAVAAEATSSDIGSVVYPYAHIGGSMYTIMLLEIGMAGVFLERFDPAESAEVLTRHAVTLAGGSVAHYQAWLALQRANPERRVLPTVRILTGGGAPKPPQLYYDALETLGIPIVHGYGMTESPMVASNTPSDPEAALVFTDGKPVAGMTVKIRRPDGGEGKPMEEGEILIKGACVFKGYLDPAQTAEAFDDEGFYRTGDLGMLDEDGRVRLTGRTKDIIIRKGENISARELEQILSEHPQVREVAVIGLPDSERGERVCAVVVPDGTVPDLAGLCRFLRDREVMVQKLPEQLEILPSLPRTEALGKVAKKELRRLFSVQQA